MTHYSVQFRDQTFAKGYGFLYFPKNMANNISKNISKSLNNKYYQKLLDRAKQSATDAYETSSKRVIQTAKTTGGLIGNKTANRITKVWKNSQQNNSEKVTNENLKKYLKKDIYLQKVDQKLLMM